jgi:hypothetical protein
MVGVGLPVMIWIHAHAAMVDPSLRDWEWRREVAKAFFLRNGGIGTLAMAFTLMGSISLTIALCRFRVSRWWMFGLACLWAMSFFWALLA